MKRLYGSYRNNRKKWEGGKKEGRKEGKNFFLLVELRAFSIFYKTSSVDPRIDHFCLVQCSITLQIIFFAICTCKM